MKKISVELYGGKNFLLGKEVPLEAVIIHCPFSDSCSFYKEGTCLSVHESYYYGCKFADIQRKKGYTSRAKKYKEFKNKWESDECYEKLKQAPKKIGLINDVVVLPYKYMVIDTKPDGTLYMKDPFHSSKIQYVPLEKFTLDTIYMICEFKPHALIGGEITDYQTETVPKFLHDLKSFMPKLYQEFIDKYPKYKNKNINFVGRKAYLKTVKKGSIFKLKEETWEWDGEYLIMLKGPKPYFDIISTNYEVVQHELKLKVDENAIVVITDNEQVLPTTKFAD